MTRSLPRVLHGRAIARGVAFGHLHVDEPIIPQRSVESVPPDKINSEVARLEHALSFIYVHLERHVREFHAPTDEDLKQVLATHQLILTDEHFIRTILDRIERRAMYAERAVEEAFCEAADRLASTRDAYLRTRAEDIRDVCQVILRALVHGERAFEPANPGGRDLVFVATHLHVSSVLRARRAGARGFITSSSAYSSHGAIFLRASGLPSVGGLRFDLDTLNEGTPVLVDGLRGEVIFDPSDETRATIHQVGAELEARRKNRPLAAEPALTADGVAVDLWANIDTPEQVELCLDNRLRGIGLFRTEFLVLHQGRPPPEEDQIRVYREVADRLRGRPLILRTFDIGAEKVPVGLAEDTGANPALGLRGIRRHLHTHPDELRSQLRAVLRATHGIDAAVLLPMVTHIGDVIAARQHLDATAAELEASGEPYNKAIKVGAMVEVPAAALRILQILEHVDFVSIGTNDLTQYLSAADRNNADVASYLKPDNSGLFEALEWMIRRIDRAGRTADVLVGGEVASDPEIATRLVILGFRAFTITPLAAPAMRRAIGELRLEAWQSTRERHGSFFEPH